MMDNEHTPDTSASYDSPALSRTDITALFLSTLTDVYNIKAHFISYLPQIAEKASYIKLKMAILDAATEVEAQIFRLNIIFKILKYENNVKPESLKGKIDIGSYIGANLENMVSYKSDFVLFTHLLMIENMEITYYRVLQMLAVNIKHKEISTLIKQCLNEAMRTRQTYKDIGKLYKADADK